MKIQHTLFIVALCLFLGGHAQTVHLSSDIWPPFTDVPGKKSLALDLVKEALVRNDIVPDFHIGDFSNLLEAIKNGESDGSGALWRSPDREAFLLFSNAYLENQLILVGRKGSQVDVESTAELEDVRIGIVKDYAYGDAIRKGSSNQLIVGESDQQNLERLLSHQVDYILVDALLIQYMLQYRLNDVSELLEIAEMPLITQSLHLALRKDLEDAASIIEKFNQSIAEMVLDGTYNKILALNWIRADVDGDGNTELILAGDKAGTDAPEVAYNLSTPGQGGVSKRFYIDGRMYDNWSDVPSKYKVPIPNPSPDPAENEATMKIKF